MKKHLATIPTPTGGLALGIASLGWCWENGTEFAGNAQLLGALVALPLLLLLGRFLIHPKTLFTDVAHPVVGGVVPTFSMAWMVVARAFAPHLPLLSQLIWWLAVGFHLVFMGLFIWHRCRQFNFEAMVPSWFVPPVGIIVAALTQPGGVALTVAQGLLYFGLFAYALLLPLMIYRLIWLPLPPDGARPTLAILAAPASLSLAGYLAITPEPSVLLLSLLFGIALLMTISVYLLLVRLVKYPFSPAFAAFTFPLVIGATALFKLAAAFTAYSVLDANALLWLASLERFVATAMVLFVLIGYLRHIKWLPQR